MKFWWKKNKPTTKFPEVIDPSLVGSYDALAGAGGGYVWDVVLEYRVWCHPHDGAEDIEDGSDYYYFFEKCEDAISFSNKTIGAEAPLALILQEEYIEENAAGDYFHIKEKRITEWPVTFLSRPRRTKNTIPDFMSPDAPLNKLDILRSITS